MSLIFYFLLSKQHLEYKSHRRKHMHNLTFMRPFVLAHASQYLNFLYGALDSMFRVTRAFRNCGIIIIIIIIIIITDGTKTSYKRMAGGRTDGDGGTNGEQRLMFRCSLALHSCNILIALTCFINNLIIDPAEGDDDHGWLRSTRENSRYIYQRSRLNVNRTCKCIGEGLL